MQWPALVLCVWEIPDSTLNPEISYPDRSCLIFGSPRLKQDNILPWFRPLPPTFRNHNSHMPCHSTLYSMSHKSKAIVELCYLARCGKKLKWKSRKWLFSLFSISTVWICYRGRAVTGPHSLDYQQWKVTAMLPRWRDSEKGICSQIRGKLWWRKHWCCKKLWKQNPLSLSCRRGNIAVNAATYNVKNYAVTARPR
jgi:hypothetical protein